MDYEQFVKIALPGTVAQLTIDDRKYTILISYFAFKHDRFIATIKDKNKLINIEIFPNDGALFNIIKMGRKS